MAVANEIASLVGNFLSVYDETALDGAKRLQLLASDEQQQDVVQRFMEDPVAVDAFVGLLARPKCPPAPVFDACRAVLHVVNKPSRVLLLRLLCAPTSRKRIMMALSALSDAIVETVVSALELLTVMMETNAKQTASKFGRKIPLRTAAFSDTLTYAQSAVRPARTRLMIASMNARHPEVSLSAVTQPGVLTKLAEDAAELAKTTQHTELVSRALRIIQCRLVENETIDTEAKRAVIVSQLPALKSLVVLLGYREVAELAASLIRRIAVEVSEPSRDYSLTRDTESTRMPNFVLFSLLRHLRPKRRALDAHIVVFILHRCPDLYRPYLLRVSHYLTDTDTSLTPVRATVSVCNLLTRWFLCPVASYLTTKTVSIMDPATSNAATFFELTPEAAADEVLPPWFAEAAHRALSAYSGNDMVLAFVLQTAQAAILRAAAVKKCIKAAFEAARRRPANTVVNVARRTPFDELLADFSKDSGLDEVDEDAFVGRFESILLTRLPRYEALVPHFSRRISLLSASSEALSESPLPLATVLSATDKTQFLVQRIYVYLESVSALFNWRHSWSAVLPVASSGPRLQQHASALRSCNPTTIRALCRLVIDNVSRHVKLTPLTHVDFGADPHKKAPTNGSPHSTDKGRKEHAAAVEHKKKNGCGDDVGRLRRPLLMDILFWVCTARDASPAAGTGLALRAVAEVVRCVTHEAIPGSSLPDAEVALWFDLMTPDDATLLVHVLNHAATLPEHLKAAVLSRADEVGILCSCSIVFIERLRLKPPKATNAWQEHALSHLAQFSSLVDTIQQRQSAREPTTTMATVSSDQQPPPPTDSFTRGRGANELREQLLRKSTADNMVQDDHTALIKFFRDHVLPRHIEEAAREEALEIWDRPFANRSVDNIQRALRGIAWDSWLTSVCGRWLVAHLFLALPRPSECAESEYPAKVCDAIEVAIEALISCSQERSRNLDFAVCSFVLARCFALWCPSSSRSVISSFADWLRISYSGTLSSADRCFFAALALIEPPASSVSVTQENQEVDLARDDDGIHGAKKRRRIEDSSSVHRMTPSAAATLESALALTALRDARFLVGDASVLPRATPEVEVLTSIVESLTDGEIITMALRMPLRISTPSALDASRPPLQIIFPDAADGTRDQHCLRWYHAKPAPNGSIPLLYSDPVSSDVMDPRYLLPLYYTVVALRYKHVVEVPITTVTRLIPYALRALSAVDSHLRYIGLTCLGLMYRSTHPIPRLIVNTARLQLQQRSAADGTWPRLLAVHTAHAVLAFGPLGNPSHPLHEACTASLSLDDDVAIPLEHLLSDFPSSAVIGLPTQHSQARREALVTTPELRHILLLLRSGCVTWSDFAFINRRHALQKLCYIVGIFMRQPDVRRIALQAITAIALGHNTTNFAAHEIVIPWCLESLAALCSTSDAANFESVAADFVTLLRRLYSSYRAAAAVHRRSVAAIFDVLRFALRCKVLAGDLLCDCMMIVTLAWQAAGPHGHVLARADERELARSLLDALNESGIGWTAGDDDLTKLAVELRK